MRSVNNDWEMFIEQEAKQWRREQERDKHGKYGEISTINSEGGETMNVSVETITPTIADRYLQHNTQNRHARKNLVNKYARDMQNGSWVLTHQGIAFAKDGTLLDGQHRLLAVVQSGTTVQMTVARGVDTKNQLAMDDHARRSAGDALSLVRGHSVSSADVAIVRAAVELSDVTGKVRNTKHELNELIDDFINPLKFVKEYASQRQRGLSAAPVQGAILLAWFYVDDLERLVAFCRMLFGIDLVTDESDRAAQALREWLFRAGCNHATLRREAFRKTQRAIVAFMKRQEVTKLYGTAVYYPYPLVDPYRT